MSLPDPHIGNLEAIDIIYETYKERFIAILPTKPEEALEIAAFLVVFGTIRKITDKKGHEEFRPFNFKVKNTKTSNITSIPTERMVPGGQFKYYNDNHPTPIKYTLTQIVIDEEETSFELTRGIEIGAGVEVGFDIGFASATVNISTTLNFEEKKTQTAKTTLEYQMSGEVIVEEGTWGMATVTVQGKQYAGDWTVNMTPEFSKDLINDPEFVDLFKKWERDQSIGKYFAHRNLAVVCPGIDLNVTQEGRMQGVAGLKFTMGITHGKLPMPPAKSD